MYADTITADGEAIDETTGAGPSRSPTTSSTASTRRPMRKDRRIMDRIAREARDTGN